MFNQKMEAFQKVREGMLVVFNNGVAAGKNPSEVSMDMLNFWSANITWEMDDLTPYANFYRWGLIDAYTSMTV